jgi:hypothetical protein
MDSNDKKAAIAAYKERTSIAGIYALRCGATGQVWVGQTPNIETLQNRLWFTLNQGSNPHRGVQEAWNAHGAPCFTFEALEKREDEEPAYSRKAALNERCTLWRTRLGALPI